MILRNGSTAHKTGEERHGNSRNGNRKGKEVQVPICVVTILVLITFVIAVLTRVIPAGRYDYNEDGQPIPNTYHTVEANPQYWRQAIAAPINGMYGIQDADGTISIYNSGDLYGAIDVAVFILLIGGFLGVTMKTGAMDAGINAVVKKLGQKGRTLITVLMIIFAAGGTSYGMAEESLAFWEITTREGGASLDGILRMRSERLVGILNGIDTSVWNPAVDEILPARYSAADLSGKTVCRRDLCRVAGFDPEDGGMVLGSVGRLTDQKGIDLIMGAAPELIRRGVRIVLLGSGEPQLEHALRTLAAHHPGWAAAFVGYSEELAHRIEAGADAFVMPSRFEPCGLNQMYSLAYGTPPVVRRVGGLADSVAAFHGNNLDSGTGFVFENPSAHELAAEVLRAQGLFRHPSAWRRLVLNGMSRDFSWDRPAAAYDGVYRRAREIRGLPR